MLRQIDFTAKHSESVLRTALWDGFFFVRNTVPESLLDEAYGLLGAFFALDDWEKEFCSVAGTNGQAGYTPPLVETPEKTEVADWKELFHWGSRLPGSHPLVQRYPDRYPEPMMPDLLVPGIGKVLTELHERMLRFAHEIAAKIGEALGLHGDYFAEMLRDGPVVNRATWYPPMALAPSAQHVWAAEHQDFDLLTVLPRATAPGLQVLGVDGEWHPATPPEGCAVVNAGMVLERLTGGFARAAVHRVIADPDHSAGRLSIVQFCHPAPWTVLTPVRVPGYEERAPRYPAITADDLFRRTMYRINRLGSGPVGRAA